MGGAQDRRGLRRLRGRRDARRHRHRSGRARPRSVGRPRRGDHRRHPRRGCCSLPHRRRRNPFDAPGLDEDLLDQMLGDEELPPEPPEGLQLRRGLRPRARTAPWSRARRAPRRPRATRARGPEPVRSSRPDPRTTRPGHRTRTPLTPGRGPTGRPRRHAGARPARQSVVARQAPFRARLLTVAGVGEGAAGRRSRAMSPPADTPSARGRGDSGSGAPAGHAHRRRPPPAFSRGRAPGDRRAPHATDLRRAIQQGQRGQPRAASAVDASGSMGARRRMAEVKTAVLSLLLDAYQRRDRVGLITFGGHRAELALPPDQFGRGRGPVARPDPAARRPHPAGRRAPRWPLASWGARRIRDPRRRALLVAAHRRACDRRPGCRRPSAADRRRRWPASGITGCRHRLRERAPSASAWPATSPPGWAPTTCRSSRSRPRQHRRHRVERPAGLAGRARKESGLMAQGQPTVDPDDGLTTRQRRNQAVLIVHTGTARASRRRPSGWRCGLEPGLADRGVPVRQVGQVAHR
jgi:hypothetical protein